MEKANKNQKKAEKKPLDEETYYIQVNNLPNDTTRDQIHKVFGKYGKIISANIRHFGPKDDLATVAFISYSTSKAADDAIYETQCGLFGTKFIRVTYQVDPKPGEDCKIVVTNLDSSVTEYQLYNIFKDIGLIYSLQIQVNKNGRTLGKATIKFYTNKDAEKAARNLNKYDLKGSKIKVLTQADYEKVQAERKAREERTAERANRGDDYHAESNRKASDSKSETTSKAEATPKAAKETKVTTKPVEEEKINPAAPQATEKKLSTFGVNDLVHEKGSDRFDVSASISRIKNNVEGFKALSNEEKEKILGRLVLQKLQDKGVKRNDLKITAMLVDLNNLRIDEVVTLIEDDKDFELRLNEAKALLASVWE
jgi:RNA recognition motif-containing protein